MHDISSNNNYLSPAIALGPNGLMCTYFSADLLGYIQGSAYKMFDIDDHSVVKAQTAIHTGGSGQENRGVSVSRIGNDSFFILESRGWSTLTPRYLIANNAGTITKAATAFATTKTETFATVTLPNNNVMVLYQDMADGNKGKAVVYNEAGDVVAEPVIFSTNEIFYNLQAKLDTNGRVIAVYTDKTDGYKAKSVVLNTDGTTARAVTAMASGAAYTRKFTAFPNLDLCVAACADTTNGVNVLWLDIFDPNP